MVKNKRKEVTEREKDGNNGNNHRQTMTMISGRQNKHWLDLALAHNA